MKFKISLVVRNLTLGAAFAGALIAQVSKAPFGHVEYYYGGICGPASPKGSPRIEVPVPPVVGSIMGVLLYDMHAWVYWKGCIVGGAPWLAIGTSKSVMGGMSLPLLLPQSLTFSYPCWLLTSTDAVLPSPYGLSNVGSSAGAGIAVSVPNLPSLIGVTIYLQWLVNVRAGGGGCPFIYDHWFTSNAAAVVIGR